MDINWVPYANEQGFLEEVQELRLFPDEEGKISRTDVYYISRFAIMCYCNVASKLLHHLNEKSRREYYNRLRDECFRKNELFFENCNKVFKEKLSLTLSEIKSLFESFYIPIIPDS